ncbi:hypothetical protein CHUAL_012751 [Chamberlinius hualienensis]
MNQRVEKKRRGERKKGSQPSVLVTSSGFFFLVWFCYLNNGKSFVKICHCTAMEDAERRLVRPHHELNIQTKLELIRDAESNPAITQKALAEKYGIGKSTVGDILRRQKFKLLEMKMNTDLMTTSTVSSPAQNNQTISSISSTQDDISYEQLRQNLIACETYNNNYNIDIDNKFDFSNNNDDLHADQHSYEAGAGDDDLDDDEIEFRPPVKTILQETEVRESLLKNGLNVKRPNDSFNEPRKRRKLNSMEPLVLFAGVDLKNILNPNQLRKCYAALRLPSLSQNCNENEDYLDENELELEDNSSEISETYAEEMSLEDAYELTQHLYNNMKKLLPEGVPYIRKCKTLMEKSLGMPITGHQTKISDYFTRVRREKTT